MILTSMFGAVLLQVILWSIFLVPLVLIIIVLRKESINNKSKIFWVVMLLFLNYIALIVYIFVPNKNVLK